MLALLLTFALAQDPSVPASPYDLRFGGLRHVQLLESRDGVVRFATQVELGTMGENWPEGVDSVVCVFEGQPQAGGRARPPVEELTLGSSMIRDSTWTRRPSWFLFELEGARQLAALVPGGETGDGSSADGILRVLDYPSGDEILAIEGVQELEDAFVRNGRGELIVRSGDRLLWLSFSAIGEIVGRALFDPELDWINAATFARGDASLDLRGWCVGRRGEALMAVPFSESGVDAERTFEIELDAGKNQRGVGPRGALRLSAWATPAGAHLALGWPDYLHGVGKLAVYQLSGDTATELWEGRPDPEVDGDSLDQCDYGQAIAFLSDANEDGVPELLACGPWAFITRVDLLCGSTGDAIERWHPSRAASVGHWLSVSADGGRVLIGGTEHRDYPEDLRYAGRACLLEIPRMRQLATWFLEASEP